jgi:hypothetical protein
MHLPNMLWRGLKRAGHVVVMIGVNSSGGAVRTPYDREDLYRPRPSEH